MIYQLINDVYTGYIMWYIGDVKTDKATLYIPIFHHVTLISDLL